MFTLQSGIFLEIHIENGDWMMVCSTSLGGDEDFYQSHWMTK